MSETTQAAPRRGRPPKVRPEVQPPAQAEAANAPVEPPLRHAPERMSTEAAAALELTPEERDQQAQADRRDEAQLAKVTALMRGNGMMQADDERDPLDTPMTPTTPQGQSLAEDDAGAFFRTTQALPPGARDISSHDGFDVDRARYTPPEPAQLLARRGPRYDRDMADPDRPPIARAEDPLAVALSARVWRQNASFDWCRDRDGRRHTFTRYFYDGMHVLVDFFRDKSDAVGREIAEKSAAIERRNAQTDAPMGYLPAVVGYVAQKGEIEDLLAGHILGLRMPDAETVAVRVDAHEPSRAASGDPIAGGALRGGQWNRPR